MKTLLMVNLKMFELWSEMKLIIEKLDRVRAISNKKVERKLMVEWNSDGKLNHYHEFFNIMNNVNEVNYSNTRGSLNNISE